MQGEQLFALAAKIAPLIRGGRFRFNRVFSEGEGKDYQGEAFAAVVTNADNQNERLYMRADWHAKDRIAVSGMRPNRGQWTTFRGSRITVAMNRAPASMAGDIARRLLPAYRKELAEALAGEAQRKAAAESLANSVHLLGLQCARVEPWDRWRKDLDKWSFHTQMTQGTIERMHDGLWHVDLGRLSFADAVRVLAWLNSQAPAPREEED